jgi:hypothetical protein
MKKLFILPVLFCLMTLSVGAQNLSVVVKYTTSPNLPDKSLIFYNGKRKLNWGDFKAVSNDNLEAAALTSAGLGFDESYDYSDGRGTLTVTVYCYFDPEQSWVKQIGRNDYILKHEQHHFDISYINTLLFIKKLKQASFTNSNYKQLIRDFYKEAGKKMFDMQNQYDTETHHGLIKDKQAEWSDKIDQQLQSLDASEQ